MVASGIGSAPAHRVTHPLEFSPSRRDPQTHDTLIKNGPSQGKKRHPIAIPPPRHHFGQRELALTINDLHRNGLIRAAPGARWQLRHPIAGADIVHRAYCVLFMFSMSCVHDA